MMNTPKEEQRAPLLSDDEFKELLGDDWIAAKGDRAESAGKKIRDFYESKITSGELRVVKTTRNSHENGWGCDHCDRCLGSEVDYNFCPGCGAQIVK